MLRRPESATRPGMGAVPFNGGTTFRLWAPFATYVAVIGSFNDWSEDSHPLTYEGNGLWSADVPGAEPGDEYRLLIRKGEWQGSRIDPYAKDVTNSVGNAVIVDDEFEWGNSHFEMPPWNELVIYEMHIGTFNDQPGGQPGNLRKAIQKLAHLKDLGINAIQVMPSFEFAGSFSWGYNPSHIFAIEDEYGGPSAIKEFIQAAHDLGIAIIFDVVFNHLGPSDLDLWRFDGWYENELGGIYFYNDWRANTPWGDTRPDYGREQVRRFLRDNALMWLEKYRVDGLRWDATAYIRNVHGNNNDPANDLPDGWELMRWINEEVNSRQPWKINIAEDLRSNPWITESSAAGAGFDAQWDANFVHPIRGAMIAHEDGSRHMANIKDALTFRYNNDAYRRVIYTESHDEVANGKSRLPSEIAPADPGGYYARKRSTLGAALVFTAPGIPMIFQGQEFLEDEWFRDTDPIDWGKQEQYAGILNLYKDLIRLRRNWHNNSRGLRGAHINVFHVNDQDKVVAFHRWDKGGPGDDVIVLANMANRGYQDYHIGFPKAGLWKVRFNSDWRGYSPDFGNHSSDHTEARFGSKDGLAFNGHIGIGPYSAVILSQGK